MRARDQSSVFSTGGKFRPDYGLLLELHALTLVARSHTLLTWAKLATFESQKEVVCTIYLWNPKKEGEKG